MGLATRITNEYRMPDLRNNTITMPGRHGVFDFGETVSERKILISCFIPPGKTDEQFLSKKDDIIEWLNPDNGLCQLILDKEPGRVYEARLTSGFSFDRAVRNSCTFDLEFFCPDPYGYAISGLLLNGCNSFRDGLVYLHNHKRQRASDHWTACRRRNIDY